MSFSTPRHVPSASRTIRWCTFFFTDVEGSTKLQHSLGVEGYADALVEHRRVIREARARKGRGRGRYARFIAGIQKEWAHSLGARDMEAALRNHLARVNQTIEERAVDCA